MAKSVNKKEAEAQALAAEGADASPKNQAPEAGQENPPDTTPEGGETEAQTEQTAAERLAELETLLEEKEAQALAAEDRAKQAIEAQEQAEAALAEVLNRAKSVAYRVSHRNAKKQHMFEMNRSPVVLRNGGLVDPEVVQFIKDNDIAIELEAI